eukprot:TRINITY_DN1174_c1_g1_i1.p1 TRINITY_DN1174_c1_g1~~TRINITY_DN1174_c1_g1_i1.p1  ORF type:complete len:114 (+),score=9.09 TRINITY_DN1174_c1_g1_i1:551-892(+)
MEGGNVVCVNGQDQSEDHPDTFNQDRDRDEKQEPRSGRRGNSMTSLMHTIPIVIQTPQLNNRIIIDMWKTLPMHTIIFSHRTLPHYKTPKARLFALKYTGTEYIRFQGQMSST